MTIRFCVGVGALCVLLFGFCVFSGYLVVSRNGVFVSELQEELDGLTLKVGHLTLVRDQQRNEIGALQRKNEQYLFELGRLKVWNEKIVSSGATVFALKRKHEARVAELTRGLREVQGEYSALEERLYELQLVHEGERVELQKEIERLSALRRVPVEKKKRGRKKGYNRRVSLKLQEELVRKHPNYAIVHRCQGSFQDRVDVLYPAIKMVAGRFQSSLPRNLNMIKLIISIIKHESDGCTTVSHKGAVGVMQLMRATASDMGVHDRFDPDLNIFGAAKYIAYLSARFNGDKRRILAAYNAGPNRKHTPKSTKSYVRRVVAFYKKMRL